MLGQRFVPPSQTPILWPPTHYTEEGLQTTLYVKGFFIFYCKNVKSKIPLIYPTLKFIF